MTERVRSVEWGCGFDGCLEHKRDAIELVNMANKGTHLYRCRPLLCRLNIHSHWRKVSGIVSAKQCCRCNYVWATLITVY